MQAAVRGPAVEACTAVTAAHVVAVAADVALRSLDGEPFDAETPEPPPRVSGRMPGVLGTDPQRGTTGRPAAEPERDALPDGDLRWSRDPTPGRDLGGSGGPGSRDDPDPRSDPRPGRAPGPRTGPGRPPAEAASDVPDADRDAAALVWHVGEPLDAVRVERIAADPRCGCVRR
jgi:hypothetical protein